MLQLAGDETRVAGLEARERFGCRYFESRIGVLRSLAIVLNGKTSKIGAMAAVTFEELDFMAEILWPKTLTDS